MNPKDIEQFQKRQEQAPKQSSTPLLDLIAKPVEWMRPTWLNGTWEYQPSHCCDERRSVDDLDLLEAELASLHRIRRDYEQMLKGKWRESAIADKDAQIAYIEKRISTLRKPKRGRPQGKASGSLSPIVEKRNGKTYPVVPGERVPKDLAFDYPEQFNWFYQWGEFCPRREKWITKSKRVPSSRVHSIKYLIGSDRPISEILDCIKRK
ncbi:hypothetical protein [Spirulina major]|uniref:hypothetical protein n=1 Tax=Spirulina major TaxID=270636 RepID=UPI001114F9C4|nr:hypothetical protein [Spirulina major]